MVPGCVADAWRQRRLSERVDQSELAVLDGESATKRYVREIGGTHSVRRVTELHQIVHPYWRVDGGTMMAKGIKAVLASP
jgi:hypothetical protein